VLTISTSVSLVGTFYVRASTLAGNYITRAFDVHVCGGETVNLVLGSVPALNFDFQAYYPVSGSNLFEVSSWPIASGSTWFSNSDSTGYCPITTYSVTTLAGVAHSSTVSFNGANVL
jgi:hypothetical protein